MKKPALLYYDLHSDVVAFSTMRQGGFSVGNYAEFNINQFCGDDEEAIRPLIETYLASLPAQKEVVKSPNVATEFKGVVINNFKHKGDYFFSVHGIGNGTWGLRKNN